MAPKWAAGIRFNERWYCSRECVEQAARAGLDLTAPPAANASPLPPMRLGVLLRHLGVITEQTLDAALASQRDSGLRLGAELLRLGLVPADSILKALAAQGSVSYLASFDAGRVLNGPSWLPAETVRALGVVPFEVDEPQKKLRVVCVAPVPRTALRALLKLTGYTAEPYLIHDDVWESALRMYRPAAQQTAQRGEAVMVAGVAAAAARVADRALVDRAVTMRSASCDRYTWVRLEGPTQISDVLVANQTQERGHVRRGV
jgi:hypothetical protein